MTKRKAKPKLRSVSRRDKPLRAGRAILKRVTVAQAVRALKERIRKR